MLCKYKPRDYTLGNSFFEMSSSARANVSINYGKKKKLNSSENPRGRLTYKLRRSTKDYLQSIGYIPPASSFPLAKYPDRSVEASADKLLTGG